MYESCCSRDVESGSGIFAGCNLVLPIWVAVIGKPAGDGRSVVHIDVVRSPNVAVGSG